MWIFIAWKFTLNELLELFAFKLFVAKYLHDVLLGENISRCECKHAFRDLGSAVGSWIYTPILQMQQ